MSTNETEPSGTVRNPVYRTYRAGHEPQRVLQRHHRAIGPVIISVPGRSEAKAKAAMTGWKAEGRVGPKEEEQHEKTQNKTNSKPGSSFSCFFPGV